MFGRFPLPKIELDGERGYVFDWRSGDKIIRLACRGKSTQRDYIYRQQADDHEAIRASQKNLFDSLQWLLHD